MHIIPDFEAFQPCEPDRGGLGGKWGAYGGRLNEILHS
jgi:hypothetical protein